MGLGSSPIIIDLQAWIPSILSGTARWQGKSENLEVPSTWKSLLIMQARVARQAWAFFIDKYVLLFPCP